MVEDRGLDHDVDPLQFDLAKTRKGPSTWRPLGGATHATAGLMG